MGSSGISGVAGAGVTGVTGVTGVGVTGGVGGVCATATAKGIIATMARTIERCFIAITSVRSFSDCVEQPRHDVSFLHGLADHPGVGCTAVFGHLHHLDEDQLEI